MLRRMARGLENLQKNLADLQPLPLFERTGGITDLRRGARQNLHPAPVGQLAGPAQIVVVLVRIDGESD